MSPHLLQAEIINNPELFVEPDPELPLALLDQKEVIYLILLWILLRDSQVTAMEVVEGLLSKYFGIIG